MKRFLVHDSVNDTVRKVRFHAAIFGATPTVEKGDYACCAPAALG